jgi:hypothetical protein
MKPLSVILVLFVIAVGCGKAQAPPAATPVPPAAVAAPDAKTLTEKSCTKCHPLTRVEKYAGSAPWDTIVGRMINGHGAKVTPEERAQIVAYLSTAHPVKQS